MITQNELKELLEYDKDSGIFTYKKDLKMHKKFSIAGWKDLHGYLNIMINGKYYKMHRLAWLYIYGELPSMALDHINNVRDDNKIENLRLATAKQNPQNLKSAHKDNSTGYLGVYFRKDRNKYSSQICVDGIKKTLGCFNTAEDAYEAYINAKNKMHSFYVPA